MRKDFEGERPTFRIIKGGKEERQSSLPEPEVMMETSRRAIDEIFWQINPVRSIQPHDAAWLGGDYDAYLFDYLQGRLRSAHENGDLDLLGRLRVVVTQTGQALTEAETGHYYLVRELLKDYADELTHAYSSSQTIEAVLQKERAEKLLHLRKFIPENEQPFIRPQPAWLDKRFK